MRRMLQLQLPKPFRNGSWTQRMWYGGSKQRWPGIRCSLVMIRTTKGPQVQ